jgi:hypothetical protein
MTTSTVGRATAQTSTPKKTPPPRKPSQRPAGTRARVPRKTAAAEEPSQRQASNAVAERVGPRKPAGHALLAAESALRRNSVHLQLPIVGELHLPSPADVAFFGGVAVLAVVGLLEWPVAVLLGLGHGLAMNQHHKVLRAFGEALEEA